MKVLGRALIHLLSGAPMCRNLHFVNRIFRNLAIFSFLGYFLFRTLVACPSFHFEIRILSWGLDLFNDLQSSWFVNKIIQSLIEPVSVESCFRVSWANLRNRVIIWLRLTCAASFSNLFIKKIVSSEAELFSEPFYGSLRTNFRILGRF